MAEAEYEQLETFFKSDLQSLDPQDEHAESEGVSADLPEWLIGVIVVVILLIIAFLVMVVYSLLKERKRTRAGSYGAAASTTPGSENMEMGKTDNNIRITSFNTEQQQQNNDSTANGQTPNGNNGTTWTLDAEVASTLQRRQHGTSGCRNPAYVDDDGADNDGNDDKAKQDSKPNGKVTNDQETGENKDSDEDTKLDKELNWKVNNDKETNDTKANTGSKENGETTKKNGGKKTKADKAKTDPKLNANSSSSSCSSSSESSSKQDPSRDETESLGNPSGRNVDKENQPGRRPSKDEDAGKQEEEEKQNNLSCPLRQESTVDEVEESGGGSVDGGEMEEVEEQSPRRESVPGESMRSCEDVQKLEVVVDRDRPSVDPQACVMVHRHQQGDTEREKEQDYSTDDTDEEPGSSTNL